MATKRKVGAPTQKRREAEKKGPIGRVLSAGKDWVIDQFTAPEDVRKMVEFVKGLTEDEAEKNALPGMFNALPQGQRMVADFALDTLVDSAQPGGAALEVAPFGAAVPFLRRGIGKLADGKEVFKQAGRLMRRTPGDTSTDDAVARFRQLQQTDEQFDKAHEAAYEGNPLTAKKSVQLRKQDALNKAYGDHVRARGGEPVNKPVERPAPTRQQPTAYISDEQAREWSTKLLQTMTKYGYKPDGSELASMLDLARAMKPRGNLRNITPSEFAQAYQRTLPQMLKGNQVGSRGNPAYQVFKKDGFFKDFNTAAGQPTTLGNWGHVGKSRPRGTAKPSRREPDPPKNLDSDPEFTPVGSEPEFVPGQSMPKPDAEAAYERLRRQGGRTPSPSNPGDSLMRQHLIKHDEPKASRYLGGDSEDAGVESAAWQFDQQLNDEGLFPAGTGRVENRMLEGTAKIPPAAARERAELMIGLLNDDDFHESALKAALQDILATHPRTLGHVEKMRFGSDAIPHLGTDRGNQIALAGDILMNPPDIPQAYHHSAIDDHLSVLNIGEPRASERMRRMQNAGQDVRDPLNDFEAARDMNRELLAHELTHVGQQLRHGYDFEKLYGWETARKSYQDNAFEISARLSETGAGARPGRRPRRRNLSNQLEQPRLTPSQTIPGGENYTQHKPSRSPDDNFQGNIPAFRSKSGMAVDVLDEMKGADVRTSGDELHRFAQGMEELHPSLLGDPGQPNIELTSQPANYVGQLKTWDDMAVEDVRKPIKYGNRLENDASSIDMLIQDLANYFTGPKFDPFPTQGQEWLEKLRSSFNQPKR